MSFFADRLETFGDRLAVITMKGERLTYRELAAKADAFAAPLGSTRRLLIVETLNQLPPLIAYLGALRAHHPVILAADGASAADSRIAEAFGPHSIFRRHGDDWALDKYDNEDAGPLNEDLAVLLSTSGSTGSSKLVRLSRKNIGSNAEAIAEYLGLDPSARPITSLPFHYSYGMSVINSHLAVGATLLLTDESVTSAAFWSFFEEHAATSLAGVPYTFELMERMGFREREHSSLRQITQAGGRLPPERVRDYADWSAARGIKFFVMYGQTEAAPRMTYLPPEFAATNADCIGVAIPGGNLKIVDDEGREISRAGEIGELVYQGPNVMMGYAQSRADLGRGQEFSELKTGDLAVRTAAGLHRIVGRKSRFSKLFGLRLNLDDIEAYLRGLNIAAAVAGNDDVIAVCVTAKGESAHVGALLSEKYGIPASTIAVIERSEIPRLASGKTDYRGVLDAALKSSARSGGRKKTKTPRDAKGLGNGALRLVAGLEDVLRRPIENLDQSFLDLGGDSLSYIEASIVVEELLGRLPPDWDTTTLRELSESVVDQDASKARSSWASMEVTVFFRAVSIIFVVLAHSAAGSWVPTATSTLFVVSGMNFGRFVRPAIRSTGDMRRTTNLILRFAIPAGLWQAMRSLWTHNWWLPNLFLLGTFFQNPAKPLYTLWYLDVLAANLILLSGIGWLSYRMRHSRGGAPPTTDAFWTDFAWVLFGLAAAAAQVLSGWWNGDVGTSSVAPFKWFWMLALGVLLTQANTVAKKRVIMGLLIVLAAAHFSGVPELYAVLPRTDALFFLALGLMVWIDRIPVPRLLNRVLMIVASSTLFIYIVNSTVITHIMPELHLPAWWPLELVVAVACGIVAQLAWTRFTDLIWRFHERHNLGALVGANRIRAPEEDQI